MAFSFLPIVICKFEISVPVKYFILLIGTLPFCVNWKDCNIGLVASIQINLDFANLIHQILSKSKVIPYWLPSIQIDLYSTTSQQM